MSRSSKFLQWINYRVRVTIQDSRMLVGTFIAYDKHMNLVLADTEEFRVIKPKKPGDPYREQKRALGLVLLRGENIVSMSAEAPPAQQARRIIDPTAVGPGRAQAIGRAVQIAPGQAPPGLAGPAIGVGAPPMAAMMPSGIQAPVMPPMPATKPPPPPMAPTGQVPPPPPPPPTAPPQ